MKRTLVIICISLASAGCERSDRQEEQSTSASQPARTAEPGAARTTDTSESSGVRGTDPTTAGRDRAGSDTAAGDRAAGDKAALDRAGRDLAGGSTAAKDTDTEDSEPSRAQPGLNAPSALERINTAGKDEQADNTGKNERDRSGDSKTSGDQSESEADRAITQRIRQAVIGNDALSSQAKNAKIITSDGVVTLRGPVSSSQEKTQLGSLANGVDGVKRVDNQLEVSGK